MNPSLHLGPRIAMLNAAIALLPHITPRPLGDLPYDQRNSILSQAVSAARQLMKLCDYGDGALTTADLKATVAAATEAKPPTSKPEWIRFPSKGRCPYTGLSRSYLYTLVTACEANGHRPRVRSVSLRRRGSVHGVRLIELQSLLDYLESQDAETKRQP